MTFSMNELYAIQDANSAKIQSLQASVLKHKEKIRRLNERIERMSADNNEVSAIIAPLANALKKYFNADDAKVLGPLGLRCEMFIALYGFEKDGETVNGRLTLTPVDSDKGLRYHYDTGEKRSVVPGSIAELNGFDNVTAMLPDELEDIAACVRCWPAAEDAI